MIFEIYSEHGMEGEIGKAHFGGILMVTHF